MLPLHPQPLVSSCWGNAQGVVMRNSMWELHGAELVCKTSNTGSTPALVSMPWPRNHVQTLFKRFGASSPHFDDMGQALHSWYCSAGFAGLGESLTEHLCRWLHIQLACLKDEYRKL